MKRLASLLGSLVAGLYLSGCAAPAPPPPPKPGALPYALNGPLIPARMTMVTAWDYPKNPVSDTTLEESRLTKEIRWGYKIFTNTPVEAPQFAPGKGSCNNCHLNGGQRERGLPLVGISGMFPEYNRRAGRLISLADRVVDCFLRSQNATGRLVVDEDGKLSAEALASLPSPTAPEVLALNAYIAWLANGSTVGTNPNWRGQNTIAADKLIPVDQLDRAKGEALFNERCTSCHAADGQGVTVGDKRPGPLWGPDSWNDGAGAARVYTLAGIIRYTMPYLDPGSLTDEEAQLLAAFIDSRPRPAYPFKHQDYLVEKLPADSVYYPKR